MDEANAYISTTYLPAYNEEFALAPEEPASMFVPWAGAPLQDILWEKHERTVGNDNCVRFDGLVLQIPADRYRYHYVRVRVKIHRYTDHTLAVFYGPRKLAAFDSKGKEIAAYAKIAA